MKRPREEGSQGEEATASASASARPDQAALPHPDPEALEREQEESLRRVEEGGIPLSAERRLGELRQGAGAFTSDLSVSGFALCHKLGLKPLSQVMGSSIYQVGYQSANWPMMMGGSVVTELNTLSDAWNEVRRLAFNRLALEAKLAGAQAIVGVQVRTAAHDWAEGAIEYVVVGTAVSRAGQPAGAEPVITDLSVADYSKLLQAGIEPAGIVAQTSVVFAAYQTFGLMEPGVINPVANYEVQEYTQAMYGAREVVMERLGMQARQLGANGIVGMRVSHSARRQEVGSANRSRGGLVITFDALGTAVRDQATSIPTTPETTIDLSI